MDDKKLNFETSLTGLAPNDWLAAIDDLSDAYGYFEQLGAMHCAAFLEAGSNLLVTFENAEAVRANLPGAEPRGFKYTRSEGWSHLALFSFTESWFRDPAIFAFFDRLIDDAFFEDFENILFHGADGGGYAAAAYSVAAPGATVLAIRPQATLDPRIAGWDPRYKDQRRTCFSSRYGYAPDMIDAANQVFVAFDPIQRLDASHAALFHRPNVTPLRCAMLGRRLDRAFDRLGIHDGLIKAAMDGTLDVALFSDLYRARQDDATYIKNVVNRLVATGHRGLATDLCNYMVKRSEAPFFRQTLETLSAASQKRPA